ncbi:hypothetical protein [Gillisia sp. Hel_I_86]|nr:hypothetical protein [Gillisia sp. Hel_I_86]
MQGGLILYFFMEGMQWTINGKTFEFNEATDHETVKLGSTQVWE